MKCSPWMLLRRVVGAGAQSSSLNMKVWFKPLIEASSPSFVWVYTKQLTGLVPFLKQLFLQGLNSFRTVSNWANLTYICFFSDLDGTYKCTSCHEQLNHNNIKNVAKHSLLDVLLCKVCHVSLLNKCSREMRWMSLILSYRSKKVENSFVFKVLH